MVKQLEKVSRVDVFNFFPRYVLELKELINYVSCSFFDNSLDFILLIIKKQMMYREGTGILIGVNWENLMKFLAINKATFFFHEAEFYNLRKKKETGEKLMCAKFP